VGGRVVIPSGSRGIPKKLPLSFRDGIARLSLGMTGWCLNGLSSVRHGD